jgi:hypothetical protein
LEEEEAEVVRARRGRATVDSGSYDMLKLKKLN